MMTSDFLIKLFEHNHWANQKIIEACSTLSAEQLDAEPHSATKGNIRQTLIHLVGSQASYLSLLTLPVAERHYQPLEFDDLQESARISGEALLALLRDESKIPATRLQTRDGYHVEPWVVIVQIINHATEHREQINSMLSAMGITPPDMDGWSHGDAKGALTPIPE